MILKWLKRRSRSFLILIGLAGRKRVFIFTLQSGANYGQQLQNFALSEKIKELGYYPKTITWCFSYINNPLGQRRDNLRHLRRKYIFSTKPIFTEKALKKTIKEGTRIIFGGDQIFRKWGGPNEYLPTLRYYGDFVSGRKVIASYAASFGIDEFVGDELLIKECKALLNRFDRISVREKSGVYILNHTFGVDGVEVLDPVFLIPVSKYEYLIENAGHLDKSHGDGYIAYMCLDIPKLDDAFSDRFRDERIINIYFDETGKPNTVEQWLYNLKQSRFVITDSFHCTAFAIIFKKPFIVISTKGRGNARIDNILGNFKLQHCRREGLEDITPEDFNLEVDWDVVDKAINDRTIYSERFLRETLNLKPTYKKPYINKVLRGIRSRYDKVYLYRLKAQNLLTRNTFRYRFIYAIIKMLTDERRFRKFRRTPMLFFMDSKSKFIRLLGRYYN